MGQELVYRVLKGAKDGLDMYQIKEEIKRKYKEEVSIISVYHSLICLEKSGDIKKREVIVSSNKVKKFIWSVLK